MINKIEAIYARQSIDKKDSVSIEAQIEMCKQYLKTENFEIYCDKGYSAKTIDRPRMNDLNQDIEDGKISRVIAYRLDRISRNIVDFGNLLTFYDKHNIEFISTNEKFDTGSPMGKAMIYIIMVFAQLERETIAGRITDNYKFRSATGKYFMGGGVPFGYMSESSTLEGKKASIIKPNENAKVLQTIFKKFNEGYSLHQIVHKLNKEGYTTANSKPWVSNGIKRILRNITPCVADERIYDYLCSYGYNVTNNLEDFDGKHGMCLFLKSKNRNDVDVKDQVVVVGLHEPLITSEQYIKAQIILDKNTEIKSKKTSKRSFLAGMVKCADCGYSFGLRTIPRKNKTYTYYMCRGRNARGICTNDQWIVAEEFEKDIIEACITYLGDLPNIEMSETKKAKKFSTNDEITILEQQIENLINSIGKGNSVVDNLLTNKITELTNKISELKKETQIEVSNSINIVNYQDLKSQLVEIENYNIDQKIVLIKKIVDYIEVSKDLDIKMYYKF